MRNTRQAGIGIKRGGRYADGIVPDPSVMGFLKDRASAAISALTPSSQPTTTMPVRPNPVADAVTQNSGLAGNAVAASKGYNDRMNTAMNEADGTPLIKGPGTPTSDSVPINASRGEAVLPADTVQAVGPGNLQNLIAQTHTPVRRGIQRGIKRGGRYADGDLPPLPEGDLPSLYDANGKYNPAAADQIDAHVKAIANGPAPTPPAAPVAPANPGASTANPLNNEAEPLLPQQRAAQAQADAANPALDRMRYAQSPSQNAGAEEISQPSRPSAFGGRIPPEQALGQEAESVAGKTIPEKVGFGIGKTVAKVPGIVKSAGGALVLSQLPSLLTSAATAAGAGGLNEADKAQVNNNPLELFGRSIGGNYARHAPEWAGGLSTEENAAVNNRYGQNSEFQGFPGTAGAQQKTLSPTAGAANNKPPSAAPAPQQPEVKQPEQTPDNTIKVSDNGHTFTGAGDVTGYSGEWKGGIGQQERPVVGPGRAEEAAPAWEALDARYRGRDQAVAQAEEQARGNAGEAGGPPKAPDLAQFPDTIAGRIDAQRAMRNYEVQEQQYNKQAGLGIERQKVANEATNVQSEAALRQQQEGEVQERHALDQEKIRLQTAYEAAEGQPDIQAKIMRQLYSLTGRTQPKYQVQSEEGTEPETGLHYKRNYVLDENGNARPMVEQATAPKAAPGLVVGAKTKHPDGQFAFNGKTVTIKNGQVTEIK